MSTYLVHPWASHRQAAGFTQQQVSERLNVSRHYIIRLEQALFAEPPPSIVIKLSELYRINPDILETNYLKYQQNTRHIFSNKHKSIGSVLHNEYSVNLTDKHPLVFYRDVEGLSRIGLCKGLCMHQQMIRLYELNHHSQRTIPGDLVTAAGEINWDLEELARAVAAWRIKWH